MHVALRMVSEATNGRPDFATLAADFRAAVRPEALDKLAEALGVSLESLRRLGIGWSTQHRAWSFPMSNAAGDTLGIRLRLPSGRKLSVQGGREGLFIPGPHPHPLPAGEGIAPLLTTDHCPPSTTLLITEGPTDTAALLDLGFTVIGRPSCTGGVKLLVELVRKLTPENVVIVADNDSPGENGAAALAAVLVAYTSAVRIISPPTLFKDVRAWRQGGATTADVQAAIDAAPVRKLAVTTQIRRKAGGNHGK
jgi:hypothetical protein